eukprot:scaffold3700_cov84-Skeletonema_marinoi.AAC.4
MDKKQNSQLNLRAMRQHLGDKYRETHDDWINSWTLTDDSASSPTQTKGYDYPAVSLFVHVREFSLRKEIGSHGSWQASTNRPSPRLSLSQPDRLKGPKGGTKGSRLPPVQKPPAKKPASIGKSSTCRERNRRRGTTSASINSYEGCSVRLHDCSIVYSDR